MIKVAIDNSPLSGGHSIRGVGFYTKQLIDSLELLKSKTVSVTPVDKTDAESLKSFNVLHVPYFNPFFLTVPNVKGIKKVITIHDVIPLIYPKHYKSGIKGAIRFWLQKLFLKDIDAIITDTEASKKDIIRFLGVQPERVYPIHLAPGKHFKKASKSEIERVRRKYNLPSRFVLYVGDINYNKNIPNLVKACRKLNVTLVICGKQAKEIEDSGHDIRTLHGPKDWLRYLFGISHPEMAHYEEILKLFKKGGGVVTLGFVPEGDLVAIYNSADVYCQASYYEGFGLPVLQAMACGTPVVVARTQALIEIADKAAVSVDPKQYTDIARGIKAILSDSHLARDLSAKGLVQVKKYSWKETARKTLDIYEKI